MPDMILLEAEERMEKAIENLKREFSTVRTGRANANIFDSIFIDYYGVKTPLRQVSSISIPEANQLLIKPYDRSLIKMIEGAINASDLGLNPQSDGASIRIIIPSLTEERRREMTKNISKYEENGKVAIRNIRRDANDSLKKLDLPEDDLKGYQDDVQKLTDSYVEKISKLASEKEKELMTL